MATDNFPGFARIVNDGFQSVCKAEAYVVGVEGDALYQRYLESFPDGTNPVFKERTEHDCSCCKGFIRHVANVVSVVDGEVRTVWDEAAKSAPYPYNIVAESLRRMVLDAPVVDLFRVSKNDSSFGSMQTKSLDAASGVVSTWNHFYTGPIPKHLQAPMPDQVRGDYRTTVQVFTRGLNELRPDAVETVADLITSNSIYRGAEHQKAVSEFQQAQRTYLRLAPGPQNLFAWTAARGPAARFRNTVIGTLVQDLSEGVEVDKAVASFETKVAPQNYKRTTAVITPGMVKKAMETIADLGLEPALERRFARIEDISVNDVLWVDSRVKPLMKGGLGDLLMDHATTTQPTTVDESKAEPIAMDDFIKEVLPKASSMEVLFRGSHLGNLMSLTAPVNPEPKQLFRWNNDFAWSYAGNVADSIKERVKKAGGNVTNAKLRVSLSWFNYDDLDLHVLEPGFSVGTPGHIYFGRRLGAGGGALDVDMNAGSGRTREPVENVAWRTVRDGAYRVVVNNFCQRETADPGFVVEVESNGKLMHFSHGKVVRNRADIAVATIHVRDGVIEQVDVGDGIITTAISQEKWGLNTEQFVKVNAVTHSPNYWGDNAVGNKHTFFVLDGAKNDEPTRGIYNEFLHPRLESHRKVFEVIGDKTKCQPTEGQLSGLGFSSTKPDTVIVRVVQGKKQRLYNVSTAA